MFVKRKLSINCCPLVVTNNQLIVKIAGNTPNSKIFGGIEAVSELYTLFTVNNAWTINQIIKLKRIIFDFFRVVPEFEFLTVQQKSKSVATVVSPKISEI